MEKNNSGNSGEHNLSPYFDSLSLVSKGLSSENKHQSSTKSYRLGDTELTGDNSDYITENIARNANNLDDININKKCNYPCSMDSRIVHNHPFY